MQTRENARQQCQPGFIIFLLGLTLSAICVVNVSNEVSGVGRKSRLEVLKVSQNERNAG
ncbi:hypothetical protein [Kosakonia pseudosacchari]|uniref:hypothetical protein n=1 Tax=Kosakonia pseudosacchari TaxID=1646340 RepID=UPI0013564387|nr:hypothetical protein [Kosakonia pseudosacchari]QOV64959.1 hypothetical protein IP581_04655 [Kosakonia pseudosacchari]